jgi:hypothetical protein
MTTPPLRLRILALTVLLGAGAWLSHSSMPPETNRGSLAQRLLGPMSEVAAAWQWVRVRSAMDDGQMDTAYSRAEFALGLAPRSPDGWSFLASNLAFDRASPDRQKDPVLRTRWIEAALGLLRRGEQVARHPEQLAMTRGLVLVHVGDSEGAIPWPGGARAAWSAAQLAFERACEMDPGATEPWAHRAANLCLRLGSPQLVENVEQRQAALGKALDLLAEGIQRVRQPSALHFQRGALLGYIGESPDGPLWPGGRVALFELSVEAFRQAQQLDFPLAKLALEGAEEALSEARTIEPRTLPE